MIHKLIEHVGGIGAFGTLSVCLFGIVFTGALIFAACMKSSFLRTMSALPLEDEMAPPVTDHTSKGAR